jgi:hypothetical protein
MIAYTAGTRTRIKVEDCKVDGVHDVELEVRNGIATATCLCCQGDAERQHGHGPYADTYQCDPCVRKGHFAVNVNCRKEQQT